MPKAPINCPKITPSTLFLVALKNNHTGEKIWE